MRTRWHVAAVPGDAQTRRARQTTITSSCYAGHPPGRRDPIQAPHVVRDKKLTAGGGVRQTGHRSMESWDHWGGMMVASLPDGVDVKLAMT